MLDRIVTLRDGEAATALMMFAYSFLAMTSYNILKPITRSQFISALGADNLPYVQLGAGLVIGVLMQLYSKGTGLLPRRAIIPVTLAAETSLLLLFWLLFRTGAQWVSVAFYVLALILGILMTSQFWTLASDLYDARQAKRLFGFIGGGASLGGAAGAGLTSTAVHELGTNNLLLVSAAILGVCTLLVIAIIRRDGTTVGTAAALTGEAGSANVADERGVGGGEAIRMLRSSRHLQVIALLIACAAIGAAIIEQQLNMAAEAMKGSSPDAITAFLAQITLYLSLAGFAVQVILTSTVHRSFGLGVALLLLPVSLGTTAALILWTGTLWAAGAARVLDTSLRYTIDKTTREVLFLPLPRDLKYRAKPFVDVTVDRAAKAGGALLALVLIKPWGLHVDWRGLSYASLIVTAVWVVLAMRARAEYLKAFRRSIEDGTMLPATLQLDGSDGATIELLVEELSSPEPSRVLYAIEMLEMLGKRNLVTPLLLHHESAAVRARALAALQSAWPSLAPRWMPLIQRLLRDPTASVRATAVQALAALNAEDVSTLLRHFLRDPEPRVAVTAAVALADATSEADAYVGEATLASLAEDTRDVATAARRDVAAALAHVTNPRCRALLVALIHDADLGVARTAIRSARMLGPVDVLFVPALVARLGHRALKSAARDVLVSYGADVCEVLAYVLNDPDENRWVRRHVPATLARIPTQRSMDVLVDALADRDSFLRYKVLAAVEGLRRRHPELVVNRERIEARLLEETARYYDYLTLRFNLVAHDVEPGGSLLQRVLDDKLERAEDRIYRFLAVVHSWSDVAAARRALTHGDSRARAAALEYMDNVLRGAIRKRVMPILEDAPLAEKVRRANVLLKTRPRDLEDTVAQLVHDQDSVVSAAAIRFLERRRLWSLTHDLEFARAHDATEERMVSETVSWALRPVTDSALAPVMGRLPTIEVVERLSQIPLFRFVSVDELFRIAHTGRQVVYESGLELNRDGFAPAEVLFLLDGRVAVTRGEEGRQVLEPPAALAVHEMLENIGSRDTITALDRVCCLAVTADEFLTMLSDNIVLAEGLLRTLLETPGSHRSPVHAPRPDVDRRAPGTGSLQQLEKVILLEQSPFTADATVNQLLEVARIARATPLRRDAVLFTEGDATAIYYVLGGEVRLESGAADPVDAGPGATIGMAETLAGVAMGWRATVTRDGDALRIDRHDLFDVLADDVELLRSFVRGLRTQAPAAEAWRFDTTRPPRLTLPA